MQEAVVQKMKHFCAYQERSHHEVRMKLLELKVYGLELERMIAELVEENYLNEERFAKALVRGKFYGKQWGRHKIKQALFQHQISEYCCKIGFREIDPMDYEHTIKRLISRKAEELKQIANPFLLRQKITNFLLQKGYESDLIQQHLHEYLQTSR